MKQDRERQKGRWKDEEGHSEEQENQRELTLELE